MTETRRLLEEIAKLPDTIVNYRCNSVMLIQTKPNGVKQSSVWLNRKNTNQSLRDYLAERSEPNLGQMFDMAYEDQCRDACGL